MKTIVIIYRDNSLYPMLVPIIEKVLSTLGFITETYSFPENSTEEEIAQWIQNQDLTEKIVLSDFTSMRAVDYKYYTEKIKKSYDLDNLADQIMLKASLGETSPESHLFVDFRRKFIKLFKMIISELEIRKIYIIKERLKEHEPFNQLYKDENSELMKLLKLDREMISDINKHCEKRQKEISEICSSIALIISGMIRESGFRGEINIISQNELRKALDGNGNLFLTDRHFDFPYTKAKEVERFEHMHFELPLSNLVDDAKKRSLLTYSDSDLSNSANEIIQKTFIQ